MIYTITIYLEEDDDTTSGFNQTETLDVNMVIRELAHAFAYNATTPEHKREFNIFIHINGVPMLERIASKDMRLIHDPSIIALKPMYNANIEYIIDQAKKERDLILFRNRHEEWHNEKQNDPVPGPGRRG